MSTAGTAALAREELRALPSGDWELDTAHTTVGFVARHMRVAKSRGRFSSFTGTIHVDDEPGRSWAEATIDAAKHRHASRAAGWAPALTRLPRRRALHHHALPQHVLRAPRRAALEDRR